MDKSNARSVMERAGESAVQSDVFNLVDLRRVLC